MQGWQYLPSCTVRLQPFLEALILTGAWFLGHRRGSSALRKVQIQRSKSRSPEEWQKMGDEEPAGVVQRQDPTGPDARQGAAGDPPPSPLLMPSTGWCALCLAATENYAA